MIERSESIKEIATALAKAQAVMHGATKDGKNPAFRSTYATLASVIEAARGPLTENGIAFLQSPGELTEAGLKVTTTLLHTSGEWLSSTLTIALAKRDPQGIGSAITYACRYSLQAMLGLPPVDDDAEAAMDRSQPKQAKPVLYSAAVLIDNLNKSPDMEMMNKTKSAQWFKDSFAALSEDDKARVIKAGTDRRNELAEAA